MGYKEGPGSTFTHNGVEYPLDPFIIRAAKLPVKQVKLSLLDWNLKGVKLDQDRVDRADVSVPILFTVDPDYGYVVIDGTHRLAKAFESGRSTISGRAIPTAWFKEIGAVGMESLEHTQITVGQVTREQAFEWLALYDQSRPEPILQESFGSYGAGSDRVYAFAWRGDTVVGYASLLNGQRYLIDLYVPETFRRQGVGRQLVDSLLVDLVVVRKQQAEIIAFLRGTGFYLQDDLVNAQVWRKNHGPVVYLY